MKGTKQNSSSTTYGSMLTIVTRIVKDSGVERLHSPLLGPDLIVRALERGGEEIA